MILVAMTEMRVMTRPDLIGRFERLGVTAYAFLPSIGLPNYYIAQMRQGKYTSPASQTAMDKLERGIAAAEAKVAAGGRLIPSPNDPDRTENGEELSSVRKALGDACESARTARELTELGARIGAMAARGDIPIALMRALHENISRREQLLADERLELERSKAGEETIVRVVYVNGWTGGPLPEAASGT